MSNNAEDQLKSGGFSRLAEIFTTYLRLGLSSFGGPIAHLGYFHTEFVRKRSWISEERYAELVSVCQFLPGPTSSQVGFLVGVLRGGWTGGMLAWLAFTLPSIALLLLAGLMLGHLEHPSALGIISALKALAVAIVAHAVIGMAPALASGWRRALIAIAAVPAMLLSGQVAAIVGVSALAGLALKLDGKPEPLSPGDGKHISRATGALLLGAFALLLGLSLLLGPNSDSSVIAKISAQLYAAGSFVYGGGHVVLPLLEQYVIDPGLLDRTTFLSGYGLAQAVPGPLFSIGGFIGFYTAGWWGVVAGTVAIFLPGLLLAGGVLPFWQKIRQIPKLRAAVSGANAGVVGVLAATLIHPIFTDSVQNIVTAAVATAGFVALQFFRWSPWKVVALAALIGAVTPVIARFGLE